MGRAKCKKEGTEVVPFKLSKENWIGNWPVQVRVGRIIVEGVAHPVQVGDVMIPNYAAVDVKVGVEGAGIRVNVRWLYPIQSVVDAINHGVCLCGKVVE